MISVHNVHALYTVDTCYKYFTQSNTLIFDYPYLFALERGSLKIVDSFQLVPSNELHVRIMHACVHI